MKINIKLIKISLLSVFVVLLSACSNVDNSWCKKTVKDEVRATFKLSSEQLFTFNGYKLSDMLPEGKAQLKVLTEDWVKSSSKINTITIIGHTDRIGSDNYNEKLGLARANTVKNYLIEQGLNVNYITRSYGKSEPLTTDCNGLSSENLKACLAPDRRVVIIVE